VISWTNFQSSDNTPIATQSVSLDIVNGALRVQLVPTTTASAGANYSVRYNSQGKFQYGETWAVPPSPITLKVKDVRVGVGTVIGPEPVVTEINIADVTGLTSELTVRPLKGTAYMSSRTAVIDSLGNLGAAAGNPGDCVRVDGTAGACGSAGGVNFSFMDGEIPSGVIDGTCTTFHVLHAPTPPSSLAVYRNGIRLSAGVDYTLAGDTINFFTVAVPTAGDILTASYRYGDLSNPPTMLAAPQVICSSTGSSTGATITTTLGTCTIPGGMLHAGDRVEVRFDFAHQGGTTPFTTQVQWGSSMVMSRPATPQETMISGRTEAALHAAGAQWSTTSWGTVSIFGASTGNAPDDYTGPVTIRLAGQMSATSSDQVALKNFTVVRYPAQSNP
jgi:hypothetical protein